MRKIWSQLTSKGSWPGCCRFPLAFSRHCAQFVFCPLFCVCSVLPNETDVCCSDPVVQLEEPVPWIHAKKTCKQRRGLPIGSISSILSPTRCSSLVRPLISKNRETIGTGDSGRCGRRMFAGECMWSVVAVFDPVLRLASPV